MQVSRTQSGPRLQSQAIIEDYTRLKAEKCIQSAGALTLKGMELQDKYNYNVVNTDRTRRDPSVLHLRA